MMPNSISVIIPTYNRQHTLGRAIDSVLRQTHPASEIIIVDDGSTDSTQELIKTNYSELTYIKQSNQGVSKARNTGIAHAKGSWIALLDSDDTWLPQKLAKQIQALQQDPNYTICHTDEIWYRNNKFVNPKHHHQKSGGWIFQHCLPLCAMSPSSIVIHKTIFTDIGLFDENLPACEDYDLWLRITAKHPVLYLDEKLIQKYGGHADQLSNKYWGMDRFRIQALNKIIKSGTLNADDLDATIAMLQYKIHIYLQGARRRGKTDEIHYYEKLLEPYENHQNISKRNINESAIRQS